MIVTASLFFIGKTQKSKLVFSDLSPHPPSFSGHLILVVGQNIFLSSQKNEYGQGWNFYYSFVLLCIDAVCENFTFPCTCTAWTGGRGSRKIRNNFTLFSNLLMRKDTD